MTDDRDPRALGAANQTGAHINKDAYAEAQDFLPLKGIDYVEFWVGNARQASAYYRALWGFTPTAFSGLETKVRDRASYVIQQNDIRFVLTAPLTPEGEIAEHVHHHGDGVQGHRVRRRRRQVGLARDDLARRRVARSSRPRSTAARTASCAGRAVHTYGDVIHSFIDRNDYHGAFAPGYRKVKKPGPRRPGAVAARDRPLRRQRRAGRHEQVRRLLPRRLRLQPAHPLRRQGHPHRVLGADVQGHDQRQRPGQVPDQRAGDRQEEEPDPGVPRLVSLAGLQHIALRTEDIVGTVRQLRENGVEFLGMPHEYYASLPDRVGDVGVPIETLEELGIEADRDEEGYLLQIFTRPIQDRPTFFFEIIERHGSRGFGVGNFKALFEAIEREQAMRGNL